MDTADHCINALPCPTRSPCSSIVPAVRTRRSLVRCCLVAVGGASAGCTAIFKGIWVEGSKAELKAQLEKITPGVTTREEARALLGEPTNQTARMDSWWLPATLYGGNWEIQVWYERDSAVVTDKKLIPRGSI
jgi:hypothetical protein